MLFFAHESSTSLIPNQALISHISRSETTSSLQQTTLEKQLVLLRKEKDEIDVQNRTKEHTFAVEDAALKALRERLKTAKQNKMLFLNKKIASLEQTCQTLAEFIQVCQQVAITIDQHIKILEEYKDPSFHTKEIVSQGSSFEKLKERERRTIDLQTRLAELEKQKISNSDDLVRRKKALAMLEEEYKEKERQHAEIKNEKQDQNDLSINEKNELFAEQKRLFEYKKELAQLRIKDIDQKLLLIDSQIMVTREKLVLAKDAYENVKRSLRVDEREVTKAEEKLAEVKKQYVPDRDRLQDQLRVLTIKLDELKRKQNDAIVGFKISPGDQALLTDWQKDPRSVTEWEMVSKFGLLAAQEALANAERELLAANLELAKAKFYSDERNLDIVRSWHTMTTSFGMQAEERLAQNIKSYETYKNELQADSTTVNDKRSAHINELQKLHALLDKIMIRIKAIKEQEPSLFKTKLPEYRTCITQLHEAYRLVRKQLDETVKLIDTYSTILATDQETLKKIEAVVNELHSKSFWKRSTQSIDWGELRSSFIPDIERFLGQFWRDLGSVLSYGKFHNALSSLMNSLSIGLLFLFFLRLLILIILFLVIKAFLPDVCNYLRTLGGGYGPLATASIFIAAILTFIQEHLMGFYLWGVLFALIKFRFIKNYLVGVSFYFLCIPYLLWMTNRIFAYMRDINHRRNYVFMKASYEHRFMLVMQPLFYATMVIFFFREAFLLGDYRVSVVPAVLLAINFILLQIALVSLVGKEEILSLIPSATPLWEWIKDHVRSYYYVLWVAIIAIIVMSNPYVGYGRQVFYVLSRLAITALLIPLLLWLHHRMKQISSDFFFYYEDGETMKERFSSAKMFYGFLIVGLLAVFIGVGIVVAAYIWGRQFLVYDIASWVHYELWSPGFDEAGRRISITLVSFFKVVLFFIAGGVLTYIINNIILKRVFDPLLIGAGVQNTIFTLIRYVGVIVALLVGMHSVGLDSVATKIGVALVGLGFALKEPLSDFFSYFIILVQRPIKIGDLIMVEKDMIGVVRHITPRSVIVRQRNSVTVIVPNSHITTKSIVNWSYSRSYSSFDDFFITVPYACDPAHIRELIFKVLDNSINVLKMPSPIVRLHDFVDNGYQFLIRGFLTADKVYDQWDIASEIRFEIVRILRANNIEIASPTRILRVLQQDVVRGSEVISPEKPK